MKNGVLQVVILEDQEEDYRQLKMLLDRYAQENGVKIEISAFADGAELLKCYSSEFDVLFMDIELPGMNGMEVSKRVRESDTVIPIIFTTNMAQYALKGYEVEASGYIVKPLSYRMLETYFSRAIIKSKQNELQKASRVMVLGGKNEYRRVHVDDIVYIVKEKNYIVYSIMGQEPVRERGNMKDLLDRFAHTNIKQCGNGCMVNLKYVKKKGNNIYVPGMVFSITLPYRQSFTQDLLDYLRGV